MSICICGSLNRTIAILTQTDENIYVTLKSLNYVIFVQVTETSNNKYSFQELSDGDGSGGAVWIGPLEILGGALATSSPQNVLNVRHGVCAIASHHSA